MDKLRLGLAGPLVFLVIIVASALPYFSVIKTAGSFLFLRDFLLIFLMLWSLLLTGTLDHVELSVCLFAILFLVVGLLNGLTLDFVQHFIRNLFFYPLSALMIFRVLKCESESIFLFLAALSLLGMNLQSVNFFSYTEFGDRLAGFYLSPTVNGYVNFILLIYLSLNSRINYYLKLVLVFISFLSTLLSQSVLIFVLESLYCIWVFRKSMPIMLGVIGISFYLKDVIYDRYLTVFISQYTHTISGRLNSLDFMKEVSDIGFLIYGMPALDIQPLDSSYLFVMKYSGLLGLVLFLVFKTYITYLFFHINKVTNRPASRAIAYMAILDWFLSFFYNMNFSFTVNFVLFSILSIERHQFNRI